MSKFIPLRVDHFSEGALCAEKQIESHKSCLPCKNGRKLPSVSSSLNTPRDCTVIFQRETNFANRNLVL